MDTGNEERLKDMESFRIAMETSFRETGKETRLMAKDHIYVLMAQNMLVTGKMI